MELFIAIRQEIIQGELVSEEIIGVYDDAEKAEYRNAEMQSFDIYDPVLRVLYDVKPVTLNKPIEIE